MTTKTLVPHHLLFRLLHAEDAGQVAALLSVLWTYLRLKQLIVERPPPSNGNAGRPAANVAALGAADSCDAWTRCP